MRTRSPRFCFAVVGVALASGCLGTEPEPERAAQALVEPTIRIGVVPAAAAVSIGSAGSWEVRAKGGAVLFTGTGGAVTVTLGSGSSSESHWRIQVLCGNDTNVAARQAAAEAAGYPTYTEPVPTAGCTRLYIGALPSTATAAERTALKDELVALGLAPSDAFAKLVTITVGTTVYEVQHGAEKKQSDAPVVLTADTQVTIAGAPYRGAAEVIRNSAGTLAGVNELPMEQYLYGVVPRELGPVKWPYLEALKAQAVAARSYGMRGLGKRAADGYDMLATTADQVYGGYAAEHPLSNQAVDETRGLVPMHGGKIIESLFFSTSGGFTANNEDVFNSTAIPYLRGVLDRENGPQSNVLDTLGLKVDERMLRAERNGDFEVGQTDYHRWEVEWTMDQISEVITDFARAQPGGFAGTTVGKVLSIDVTERSTSGRVKTIEYVTEAGTFTDTKDRVRSSLRFFDANGAKANLYSSLFLVEPIIDCKRGHKRREVLGYRARGGGFGHGVGMNQTGAAGMAARGHTFDTILRHYYQEIDLDAAY